MFGKFSSPLNKIVTTIGVIFMVNNLIYLTNIPFLFSMIFISKQTENIPMIILTSVSLGPSFSGAISVLWRFINTSETSVWKIYWKSYRNNFWQSIFLSGLFCLFFALMSSNLHTIIFDRNLTYLLTPTLFLMTIVPLLFILSIILISRFEVLNKHVFSGVLYFIINKPLVSFKSYVIINIFLLVTFITSWNLLYLIFFSLPIYLVLLNIKDAIREIEIKKGFNFIN